MAGYIGSKAVLLSTTAATVTGDAEIAGDLTVDTNTLVVDGTNNNVGIGSNPTASSKVLVTHSGSNFDAVRVNSDTVTEDTGLYLRTTGTAGISFGSTSSLAFFGGGAGLTERMRIDASGNVLVGKTAVGTSNDGFQVSSGTNAWAAITNSSTTSADELLLLNRRGNSGEFIQFKRDTATVGFIQSRLALGLTIGSGVSGGGGLLFYSSDVNVYPARNSSGELVPADNQIDLGSIGYRWDDVYATNGTIQTSDANEKQQIAELTAAEMQAAKAISKLFKTFKWNDSVAEKGDDARIHSGVIAQEVEAAMADAGLVAGKYAFFISSTWWESTEVIPAVEEVLDEEGSVVTEAQAERTVTHQHDTAEEAPEGAVERNRKGIRYPQLLAFVGAATEQRLASIEARLDALEAN